MSIAFFIVSHWLLFMILLIEIVVPSRTNTTPTYPSGREYGGEPGSHLGDRNKTLAPKVVGTI